jgi:hypothetical protein
MADIPIIPGVKVATKGILNKPIKDIICAILFGGLENMLKGNLLCVQADIDALLQDNFPGVPSLADLKAELTDLKNELKAFEEHMGIKDALDRVNKAIAEVQNLLALDGMCKIPLKAPMIPDVLGQVIDAEFAQADAILKDLGRLGKPELCLAGNGGINTGQYNAESILGSIQKHIKNMEDIPSQKLAALKANLSKVTKALKKSINRELFPDFRHKHNLLTGKPYAGEKSVITLAPAPAVQWNPPYPPATAPNLKDATATAQTLVASVGKTASYPATVNGIQYANIWPGLVGPELYSLAVTALTPADPLFVQQDPIYDYCGKLVGYSSNVVTGDPKASGGDPTVGSNPNPPKTNFNIVWIDDRKCWAVTGVSSEQLVNGKKDIYLNSNPEIVLHRGYNHILGIPSYDLLGDIMAPELFICYVDRDLKPRMLNGSVEKFNLGLSRLETYELLEDANGSNNQTEAILRKQKHMLGTTLYIAAENKVYSGTTAPEFPDKDVWWYNTTTCVAKRWTPDNLETGVPGYWTEVSEKERTDHWFGSSIQHNEPHVGYLAYSTEDGKIFGLLKLI